MVKSRASASSSATTPTWNWTANRSWGSAVASPSPVVVVGAISDAMWCCVRLFCSVFSCVLRKGFGSEAGLISVEQAKQSIKNGLDNQVEPANA